jgi:predicted dehydrogenase
MTATPRLLRVGLIGAGANMRSRHIPGLRALPGVEIVTVCNRRPESTASVAREFGIPRTGTSWEEVVRDPEVDGVVIGTWPYLHCPITLAALQAGKHVLTEARMAMNAAEAHRMLAAARRHPERVCQVVPSPFGLKGDRVMRELIAGGFLGRLRHVEILGFNNAFGDESVPLSWRQDAALSGFNMLTLGILHETLLRWAPPPVRVLAQVHAFITERTDSETKQRRAVGTPDSVQVLTALGGGARAVYDLSGVAPFGQGHCISLFGTDGVLEYDLTTDRIRGASTQRGATSARRDELAEIAIPAEKVGGWRVEEEFVEAIRDGTPIRHTDFATAVAYMEFTEAVARSARNGVAVELPLLELVGAEGE